MSRTTVFVTYLAQHSTYTTDMSSTRTILFTDDKLIFSIAIFPSVRSLLSQRMTYSTVALDDVY